MRRRRRRMNDDDVSGGGGIIVERKVDFETVGIFLVVGTYV